MQTVEELFSGDRWLHLVDVADEVDANYDRTKEELLALFLALPETIRDTAHAWSLGDTVFRDEAFVHWRDHGFPDPTT